MDMKTMVGERIAAIRQYRGMSQAELADGICSRQLVSKIESGTSVPRTEVLALLLRRLDYPISGFAEIYAEEQPEPNEIVLFALAVAAEGEVQKAFGITKKHLRDLSPFTLRHLWGRILEEAGHSRAALAVFRTAIPYADGEEMIECFFRMGRTAKVSGDLVQAHGYYTEALYRAGEMKSVPRRLRNKILNNIANVEYALSSVGAALVHYNESLVLARMEDDVELQIYALLGLSTCYLDMKEYERASSVLTESEKLCTLTGRSHLLPTVHNNLAIACKGLGRTEDAVALLNASIEAKKAMGAVVDTVYGLNELTQIRLDAGDREGADYYNQEALALVERLPFVREKALTYELTARLMMVDGLYDEALGIVQQSLDSLGSESGIYQGRLLCLIAEINLRLGRNEPVLENIRLASKLFDTLGKEESRK